MAVLAALFVIVSLSSGCLRPPPLSRHPGPSAGHKTEGSALTHRPQVPGPLNRRPPALPAEPRLASEPGHPGQPLQPGAPGAPGGAAASISHPAGGVTNILVAATDAGGRRTDVIVLVHLDEAAKRIVFLWVPRDTRVVMAVSKGASPRPFKINAANVYGGMPLLEQAVTDIVGIRPDFFVKTDFATFQKAIDLLGGVTLQVRQPMDYEDHAAGLSIHIGAGEQHLNGEEALGYVRWRADGRGDIGRISRQQDFVATSLAQWLSRSPRLLLLLPTLLTAVQTDAPVATLVRAGSILLHHPALSFHTLPGVASYIGGVSYWIADAESTRQLVAGLHLADSGKGALTEQRAGPVEEPRRTVAAASAL